MKVILDTNVLLSAFAARGLCDAVLEVCVATQELMLCEYILVELEEKLRKKLKMSPDQASEIMEFLREQAQFVECADVPVGTCRDEADLPILGAALACQADILVTGDADLLVLKEFHGTSIMSPRTFHERLAV